MGRPSEEPVINWGYIVILVFAAIMFVICWSVFKYMFKKDRSRYRNCYMLFIALVVTAFFIMELAGEYMALAFAIMASITVIFILIVPFFFIINGFIMLKKEGLHISHMLSLSLGLVIFVGEFLTILNYNRFSHGTDLYLNDYLRKPLPILGTVIILTIIYGSMSFLLFMIYVIFLQIVPKKNDFDYIIIHGAGLLEGDRISRLLSDRIDKAIDIYKKAPNPPKIIPSGGKGDDETISEAEAMEKYLIEKGIPREDIIIENESKTTYENIYNSKKIIESREGRKYTALVTSNYHVYRALRYCRKTGLQCTGIGSRVAFYYWPSALIREYIAVHAEKKHAVIMAAGWVATMVLLMLYIYKF